MVRVSLARLFAIVLLSCAAQMVFCQSDDVAAAVPTLADDGGPDEDDVDVRARATTIILC